MNFPRLLLLLLLALPAFAPAQSLSEYLKMRKSYGIALPTKASALPGIVGTKIIELSGVVKGTFRVGEKGSIMLDTGNGKVQVIECEKVPEWMVGNEARARAKQGAGAVKVEGKSSLRRFGLCPIIGHFWGSRFEGGEQRFYRSEV